VLDSRDQSQKDGTEQVLQVLQVLGSSGSPPPLVSAPVSYGDCLATIEVLRQVLRFGSTSLTAVPTNV
jgi:hypothetical protein